MVILTTEGIKCGKGTKLLCTEAHKLWKRPLFWEDRSNNGIFPLS